MDQTASHHNELFQFEYLENSDLKSLSFDTPADVERAVLGACCGTHQVGLCH